FGGRTVAQLGLRKKFEDGGCQQVGGRVAEDLKRLGIFFGQDAQLGIFFNGTLQINEWDSTPFDEGLICAARAALASRGEMDMATSCAVAPLGNSFSEPSGSLILMVSDMSKRAG